jgi:hypothetical protein
MKNLRAAALSLALLVPFAPTTLAQVSPDGGVRDSRTLSEDSLAAKPAPADSVATARFRYAADVPCSDSRDSSQSNSDARGDKTVAQRSGPLPPPMQPGPMAYPASYGTSRAGSGRRLAIGAAIGLGIGAAIGVKAGEHQPSGVTVKASAVLGILGAAIGAAIASMPSPGYRNSRRYRGRRPRRRRFDNDGEMAGVSEPVAIP